MQDKEYETAAKFAKRVGLPEDFIRTMAKQGEIPIIKPGKRNVYICVQGALTYLQ